MKWPQKKNKKKSLARQPRLMPGQEDYAFRRSRTITGTTSATINPSAEPRSQLKTPRLKAHELYQQRARVVKVLIALGCAIIVLAFLLVNYTSSIPVHYAQQPRAGAQPDTARYQTTIDNYFAKNPLQRFGFLLDKTQLEAYIRAEHSEVESTHVERAWYGGSPDFTISFREPLLVWQTSNQRFYVDGQGIAFTYDHFGKSLVSVADESGVSPDEGGAVASQRFIRFLGKLVGAVSSSGMGDVEAIIIPSSTREIDLRLKGRGYPIKTHIDRDPLQQAEDIANALKHFDEKSITPEYMDVRVAGKAFYK